jgi:hypothetical protein
MSINPTINMSSCKFETATTDVLKGLLFVKETSTKRIGDKNVISVIFQEMNKDNIASKEQLDKYFDGRRAAFFLKATPTSVLVLPARWCSESGRYDFYLERKGKRFECAEMGFKAIPDSSADKAKASYYNLAVESIKRSWT